MRKPNNLPTCRLSWNLGASTSWNPRGLSSPAMGLWSLYIRPNEYPEQRRLCADLLCLASRFVFRCTEGPRRGVTPERFSGTRKTRRLQYVSELRHNYSFRSFTTRSDKIGRNWWWQISGIIEKLRLLECTIRHYTLAHEPVYHVAWMVESHVSLNDGDAFRGRRRLAISPLCEHHWVYLHKPR